MTLVVRLSVSLLLLCALLKISQASCDGKICADNETETLTADMTTVTFGSEPNCNLSIGNQSSGQGSITGLTSGAVYSIFFSCLNCCKKVTTKPQTVSNLQVIDITTSSMFLKWTKPNGNSPIFRVHWTDGKDNKTVTVTETSKKITNLTAGVQYNVSVTAVAEDKITEGEKATVSKYTKPRVVRNLAVMSVTTSSMFVNWTEPEGESSVYRVQWKTNNGKMNKSSDVTETQINITNLTAGVQYEISVTAMVKDGSAEGESTSVFQYTKPDVVRNLSIVTVTTFAISLNWTEPEGNISHYRVQWTNGTTNGNKRVTETNINVTQLTAGVQYIFTVIAVAGDNTTESAAAEISHYTKPRVVRNLAVMSVTTSSMFVNWTEPEGESSVYRVQWKTNNGKMNKSSDVTETQINITNLTAGVQYEISVTAMVKDGSAEGESTSVFQYTKPEIVRDLSVVTATTSTISLEWAKPEGNISHYRVQWTNGTTNGNKRVTETNINVTQLTAGVQYIFTVIAVAGDNTTESAVAEISHYTKPEVVRNLTVSGVTTSSMFVNWTGPEGESSSYRVEWTNGKIMETVNVTQTHINITNLTAGVQYEISVSAVVNDGSAEGESTTVSQYTKPDKIGSHNAFPNRSSIFLNWTAPSGDVFRYKIDWHNGGTGMVTYTQATSTILSDLSPGTSYTIQIRAVNGADETGEPYTFTSDTKPAVVKDLTIEEVTASSVSLTWTRPEGNATSYIVQWTREGKSDEKTTMETSINITGLSPGFQYNITVSAVSGDPKNEGEGNSKTTFTKPVEPANIGLKLRKTDSLNITWTLPDGRVDQYVVSISNEELKFSNHIRTTETSLYFTGLKPGRVYVITVTAVAGDFNKTSEASFATDPAPPGPIVISLRTNSSLHIQWELPAEMSDAPNISYLVTYSSPDGHAVPKTTTVNHTELSPLSSGTLYNISVQIVGPKDIKSSAVYKSVYTMPNPVLNLLSRPKSTTSVEVKWSEPDGVQVYYKYSVKAVSPTGKVVDLKVNSTSTNITDLEPGTRYNISVRTIAAPGVESTDENTFSYTLPKAVTGLTVTVTPTTVELSWQRQSDHKPSYSYRVQAYQDNKLVQNNSTNTEKFTFSSLCSGGFYTFKVNTVVEEVMSAETSISSNTKPAAVRIISFLGNTTSFSVSWTAAGCHVDSYTVRLHRNGELVRNSTDLSNTTVTKLFVDLKPGVLYCAEVVSKSGLFENTSPRVCNATFPNPPGPIMVESQTEDTINFTWSLPEDMDHRMYNFSVSSSQGSVLTENFWFLLENLDSGTLYSFSVVTVGVMNYESTAVTAQNYTRPYPVTLQNERTQITTNNVTLFWYQQESKPHYTYVVQASSSNQPEIVTDTTKTISGLFSGSKYSFTVTAQTADGTQAAPVTVSYFTRPYGIRGLIANTINTTGVHLSWTEPLEYKPEYTYRVETTDCDSLKNQTQSKNSTQISELTPGTKCTFCVTVRAADNIEGEGNCISQYTKPETVQPSISSSGSNSSILVQWARPAGRVERYRVHLNSTTGADKEEELSSSSTSFLFDSLSAGMIYSAMVTTISGPFNETSLHVVNATFPNPPGQIEVLKKTTSSLHIKWDEAPLMTGASFFYRLSNISSQRGDFVSAKNTSHTFTALLSGTPYNISVATVGAMSFQSERVQISMVNTRPYSVTSLHVSETEEDITVTWNQPDQYKESYHFSLTRHSSDELRSFIAKDNTFSFDGLTPGSRYNISVTTQTADGTQSDPKQTSTCTKASPVTNFTCEGPNKTNAKLVLTWNCPRGLYSGFQISVNDGMTINLRYPHCHHTVTRLSHYTQYNLTVKTQSCGLSSSPIYHQCKTGITDPPVPEDDKSLVRVQEILHYRFSLQINSSLLNSTNGPIRHVGVLVTDKNLDTSVFRKFLEETYDDWKAEKTPVYLATVRDINPESRSGDSQVNIEVGDESVWNGYSNGVLRANKNYKVAVVIFTDLNLQNNLVNGQQSLVSVLPYSVDIHLPVDPAVIGLAVGATLGIFCILFIILIGFIVYWRRLSIKESPDIQIHPMRSKSAAVRVEDFEAHYKKQKADSNCGFAEEFEDLKIVGTGQSKTNALTLENKPKNRYNNVLPYDSSRVKLSIIHGNPHDDYINANYMPGYNSRKEFIAAQGPLPHTVKEFWRMIWEKNVQTLVMLTRCNEQGRVKCEQYWAPGTKHFENIIVTTTSEIPLKDWTIRDFDVKNVKTAETRSVRHFHFTAWPDHGVPETTELLISFRHLVREHMDQYSKNSPTVVHCSAGVGRTGTFIAIDHLIIQIERENMVDVYGIVHDLRMHRPLMVQTEDQYVFLNQCAIDIIRSRTGNNVDLIYQNTAALSIYENVEPIKSFSRNGY